MVAVSRLSDIICWFLVVGSRWLIFQGGYLGRFDFSQTRLCTLKFIQHMIIYEYIYITFYLLFRESQLINE